MDKEQKKWEKFYYFLLENRCIHIVWKTVLDFISSKLDCHCDSKLKDDALLVLCIYFSLLDIGNTCICLSSEDFLKKWDKEWQKLFSNNETNAQGEFQEKTFSQDFSNEYKDIVRNGISEIIKLYENKESIISKFFTIKESLKDNKKWLFARKYFNAIKKINLRLSDNTLDSVNKKSDIDKINEIRNKFKDYTLIKLNDEQCECIYNGSEGKNFIITGGPGTGKTTVVTYMLWNMFSQNKQYIDWDLKFAAPSGKASKRIKESIIDELNKFFKNPEEEDEKKIFRCEQLNKDRDANIKIYKKLKSVEPLTIHKLLNIDYSGHFRFNSKNPFNKKTILIIDEASMIDICLFSSIFNALPSIDAGGDKFRLLILGDEKQLPSVESGAVLGNILASKKDKVIALIKSNRFKDESMVGRFAKKIQCDGKFVIADLKSNLSTNKQNCDYIKTEEVDDFVINFGKENIGVEYPVITLSQENKTNREKRHIVEKIVEKWASGYYKKITKLTLKNYSTTRAAFYNELKKLNNDAQILCAERQGIFGAENINEIIKGYIKKENKLSKYGTFYPGEKVIITENISSLSLSNGDVGIVILENNGDADTLKVKFDSQEEPIPLDDIPTKSIQTSYAMTIHKSQGSGFANILVFLPQRQNHPLLTRQILYTAITRTKGSTYIFASDDTIEHARINIEERDTGLECVD